jgi:hypothetical protein
MVRSLLEDIMGYGLRILLLGSYDNKTKKILDDLRKHLNEKFERYSCITLLLENIDFFLSLKSGEPECAILIEKEGERGTAYLLESKTKPLAIIDYFNEDDFKEKIGQESKAVDFKQFRKLSELEKVDRLEEWADLIYLVRHLESTRGGELVELAYLLLRQSGNRYSDRLKYEVFYKIGIEISTMIKEIVGINKIDTIGYDNYKNLLTKVFGRTESHISRLNLFDGRFKQFENL